jgi:hypothetical protein
VPLVIKGASVGFKRLDRLQGDGELRRFDRRYQQLDHGRINTIAAHNLAGFAGKIFVQWRTDIQRADTIGQVPHRHATAADATPYHPLPQRPTFAHGTSMLVRIARAILLELLHSAATLRPADRGRVMIVQDRRPVVALDLARVALHARRFARQGPLPGLGAPIDVRPGVEGIVQDGQHAGVTQRSPHPLAFARALPQPIRYLQPVIGTMLHHGSGRLRGRKPLEDLAHRVLDFLVGIAPHLPGCIVDQPDREPPAQGALLRFFELATDETTVEPVQCCFAHGASESSEQPIIILPRIIDPICVDHQGIGQGTDRNEAVPVAARTGQAGRFSTQDGSRPTQADFREERLKAVPTGAGGPGTALVLGKDDHEMRRPSQVLGALSAWILSCRTGRVVADLHKRRLAHVDERGTGHVLIAELDRVAWGNHPLTPVEKARTAS